jgi:hypothetical protein
MTEVSLHPSVRERSEPRLSANQLAEYLVFGVDRAETIVHDAKFLQAYIPTWYDDSQAALVAYLLDPKRRKEQLFEEIERLNKLAENSTSADERDRAALDAKVLERFLRIENSLGLNALGFVECGKCAPLLIEGVLVSVQPDLLVQPLVIAKKKAVGAILFRLSKGIDHDSAKKAETREKRVEQRREMARYSALLASMILEKQFGHLGEVSLRHCFAVDVPLGEAIPVSTGDRIARAKRIAKACRQIDQLWPNIPPRPSICLR